MADNRPLAHDATSRPRRNGGSSREAILLIAERVEMLGESALAAGHGRHIPVRVLNPGVPAMKAGVSIPAPPPLLVIVLE